MTSTMADKAPTDATTIVPHPDTMSPSDTNGEAPAVAPANDTQLTFTIKWQKQTYTIDISSAATLGMLKHQLYLLTRIQPAHQKLILKKVTKPADTMLLSDIDPINSKLMLVGTPESDVQRLQAEQEEMKARNDSVVDDLDTADTDYRNDNSILSQPKVQLKLAKVLSTLQINWINPSRQGKKLLVLDIDYTIFDMRYPDANDYNAAKRPYTDDMLKALYPYYDFVFWSQTSWRWLEIKLTEMNILTATDYKVLFVLDKQCMFRVKGHKKDEHGHSIEFKHHVKPLQLIWSKCSQYGPTNTIHIDDLARNFALNAQQGMKCSAYRDAQQHRNTDRELVYATQYLLHVAKMPDLSKVDHSKWKETLKSLAPSS